MDPGSGPALVELDLSQLYGVFFLCLVLSTVLWTLLMIQTVYYFMHYSTDRWITRVLVVLLCLSATAFEVVMIGDLWNALLHKFGNPSVALDINPPLTALNIITAFSGLLAQLFFTHRIFHFIKQWPLKVAIALLIAPLVVAPLALSLVYTAKCFGLQYFEQLPRLQTIVYVLESLTAACDVAIAAVMSALLHASRGSVMQTNHILRTLMIASLNSGCWTAAFALATVILIAVQPSKVWYSLPGWLLCNLYGVTVLGNLIAREPIRRRYLGGSTSLASVPDGAQDASRRASMLRPIGAQDTPAAGTGRYPEMHCTLHVVREVFDDEAEGGGGRGARS